MIETLALKHDLWVKMAKGICKDAYLADDLVSEMYLKLSNYNKEVNEYYVYYTIKHLFINWLRQEKQYTGIDVAYSIQEEESDTIANLKLPDFLTWVERQILTLRQTNSCRDIEKQYHINYVKVHRIENQGKQKLQAWANKLKEQGISLQQLQDLLV